MSPEEQLKAASDAALAAAQSADDFRAITIVLVIIVVMAALVGFAFFLVYLTTRNSQSQTQFNNENSRLQTGATVTVGNELGLFRTMQGDMVALEAVRSKAMTTLAEGMTTLTGAQTTVAANIGTLTATLADSLPKMVAAIAANTEVLKEVVSGQAKISGSTDSIDESISAILVIVKLLKIKNAALISYLVEPTEAGKQELKAGEAAPEAAAVTVTA